MTSNKTVPTDTSIEEFLSKLSDENQVQDSKELVRIFEAITGEKAVVWATRLLASAGIDLPTRAAVS